MKPANRTPDFGNLETVLAGSVPPRPTLFEFFLNRPLYDRLASELVSNGTEHERAADPGPETSDTEREEATYRMVRAFFAAGYDYATTRAGDFAFPKERSHKLSTISQNEGALIWDESSFAAYPWPDPDAHEYDLLDVAASALEPGMKLIVHGPGGVLENVTDIVSYETLCFMLLENPALARSVFDEVGTRLVRYYERCRSHGAVGALISNDDWGFKTQTMISPAMMAEYVFPWHKKIVETIHGAGKPAILHSCGNLDEVMDVVIDQLNYDAKHSFEDAILPIEDAYRRWGSRIAILGGIDVDFMCSAHLQAIYNRSKAMLELAADGGGYALGSGNSIPEYVPDESYFAMTRAAWE